MSKTKPTYQELETRLVAAESIVKVLKNHEVDAVVGEERIAVMLVRGIEETLRISDAGFSAMFALPGIGMVQADTPAFRFTRVNQKFCEIAGYSAEELLTKTYIGLTHPQDRRRDMSELSRLLCGKADSWSIEKRCLRKDGSVVWMGVNGAVLRDGGGRVVRILAMISELTANKQAVQKQRDGESSAKQGKPVRLKKVAVKKVRGSASAKPSDKPRLKKR